MDLAKLLAYGDPYLSNTFYFVVQPLALFVMVSLPLVLPWVGARLAGRSGLAVVTLLAIAAIVAQSLWWHQAFDRVDAETADGLRILGTRLFSVEFALLGTSSLAVYVCRKVRERRKPPLDLQP